ncbi:MAG: peptide chain release factor N(5)-glutamine methyltransferase [Proteobacteria bacterium]|nr:peptide chain release factor N(5)-glutamine methyltransferase [Pseudomonadota bacterium]
MATIGELLKWASDALKQSQDVPQLEAQVLLAHVLDCSRSALYAWPEKEVSNTDTETFQSLIQRRLQHEPIAYLTGHKEFWSLDFEVTKDTLIPRADTELLIKVVMQTLDDNPHTVIDLGTGCGAIACTLAHLKPKWQVVGLDISKQAIQVAQKNAQKLNISNVEFLVSNWFESLPPKQYDAIVGNPPYIRGNDVHLIHGDLPFEPTIALTPGNTGFEAYEIILNACKPYLKDKGLVAFEHGFDQGAHLSELLAQAGFGDIETFQDLAGKDRVTIGHRL